MANAWKKVRRRPAQGPALISAAEGDENFASPRQRQLHPLTSYAKILSMVAKQKKKCAILFVCHKSSLAALKSAFPGMSVGWVLSVHMEKMALFFFDNKRHMLAFSRELHKRVDQPMLDSGMRWWCADHNGHPVYC